MNCVIKKVNTAQQTAGTSKYLHVFTSQYEDEPIRYCYIHSTEKFERLNTSAYEIWILYGPEGKKNNRQQQKIASLHYYDLAEGKSWQDFIEKNELERILRESKTDPLKLEALIDNKVIPLQQQIQQKFSETAEGKAQKKIKETLLRHQESKRNFESVWGAGTYDFIYDVFGNLKNEEFLNWLQSFQQGPQKKRESTSANFKKSQQKKQRSNSAASPSFTESEKVWLKKFYRTLAREYHPDSGGETEAMILINKLKGDWDI